MFFIFLPGVYSDAIGTHFLKQLPTHIAHPPAWRTKAQRAIASTKALSTEAIAELMNPIEIKQFVNKELAKSTHRDKLFVKNLNIGKVKPNIGIALTT